MSKSLDLSSFELIFEHSPIPLWEIDYTEMFSYFDTLKEDGVKDLKKYLIENPTEFLLFIDKSKITQLNQKVLDLYEIDSKEELELNGSRFFTKKSREIFIQQLNHFFKGNTHFSANTEIITKNNTLKHIRLKSNLIKKDEKVLAIVSTEDIGKEKIQEQQFKDAVVLSPDSITISRISDGKFTFINQSFTDTTGYTDTDVKNKSAFDLGMWINEKDRDYYISELQKKGFIKNLETSFQTKEGRTIDTLLSAKTIVYNEEPSFIVTSKDVTEINELTQKIKLSEEQFRKAFMNIPDAFQINKVSDATFVDVNETFLKYTGYTRKELIGKTPHDLNIWVDGITNRSFYRPLKKDGHISNLEITFRMKNGSLLQALISADIIELNGEAHIITVTKDMTEIKAAQDKLKRSEEKFQSIFSNSPDALAIMEMDNWTYVEVNEMFTKITRLSYQEIIGKSTFNLNLWTRKSDRKFFTQKLQNKEEIINHESLFTLKNGKQIHMLVSAKLIDIGNKKYYLIIAKNINDFVNIQKALFEKDNNYKTIVNNSYEGITIIDNTFHFEYVNHQMEIITGYTTEELIGKDFREFLTPESATLVGRRYKDRQEGKSVPQYYTFQVIRKSGEIRHVEIHSSVIKNVDGKNKTIAQLLDVTERKKTALIIEKEHQRARQYFEVAGTIMIVLDTHGSIIDINKKGCEILETTKENIVGKNWFSTFLPKNESNRYRELFNKSMEHKEFHDNYFENKIKTVNGKEKLIAWRNSLLRDENNKIIGTISSGEDITNKEEAIRILNMSGMVAILWKNENGSPIEFVSDNSEILFGYKPKELYSQNMNYLQFIHPDDIGRLRKETEELSKKERNNFTHHPYRIITKDNKIKWVNDRTTVQYNSEGEITHFYGVLSDITDDISRIEKLRQSEEILSQMNDGLIITDLSGKISTWTGKAEYIFGYKNHEILGEQIHILWKDEDRESLFEEIISSIDIYGYFQKEITGIKKDASAIPLEFTAKTLLDTAGKPLSLVIVSRDITNRKIAQKALEESETRYRHIFESILDGVIIYNMKAEIVQVNKMAISMYGYSYTEFTQSTSSRYINPVKDHSFEEVINHLDNSYTKMFEGESIDKTKNGKSFFVNVKGRLINYNNEPHLLIIVRDITKVKQAGHDLLKAKEKAEENEKLKSAFLANMSHEIRTPMNSIIGFSDLLGEDDISQNEKDHFIRIIRQNGNQLMSIINDIIDISKIESGQIKLNYERINLCETLKDIFNMFEISALEKNLKLILKPDCPKIEYFIITDELRLKQILINLISNALKFTQSGFVEFGYYITDHKKSIRFYVKDSGIGISKDKQDEIFQRFMQAELKTTKLYGGTGLGLAISQGLVNSFRGKIWLESEEGNGSTFNFSLPLIEE
ncbi:MAG: PAS domain S-box protein [Bacteroidales bacterium]|nr:PAS domain S-box protein [Bacteroidales bacterium]